VYVATSTRKPRGRHSASPPAQRLYHAGEASNRATASNGRDARLAPSQTAASVLPTRRSLVDKVLEVGRWNHYRRTLQALRTHLLQLTSFRNCKRNCGLCCVQLLVKVLVRSVFETPSAVDLMFPLLTICPYHLFTFV